MEKEIPLHFDFFFFSVNRTRLFSSLNKHVEMIQRHCKIIMKRGLKFPKLVLIKFRRKTFRCDKIEKRFPMSSPLFTAEQMNWIHELFESRLGRTGSSMDFSKSIAFATDSINKFENYFETLSPQLTGTDKQALFSIRNDFNDVRHAIYQTASQLEVLYRRFKLKPTTSLVEHLNARNDEQLFKQLLEQSRALQNKLTNFHSTYFWCQINRWSIIAAGLGFSVFVFAMFFQRIFPESSARKLFFFLALSFLLAGLTAFLIGKFQEKQRDPTTTMLYLEEIHRQFDKLRFQFDDLRATIDEETRHEFMQTELDVIIESIRQLKLLCFP